MISVSDTDWPLDNTGLLWPVKTYGDSLEVLFRSHAGSGLLGSLTDALRSGWYHLCPRVWQVCLWQFPKMLQPPGPVLAGEWKLEGVGGDSFPA